MMLKYHIVSLLLAFGLLCVACTSADVPPPHETEGTVLRMRFEGSVQDYGPQTRAGTSWTNGDRIYLQFTVGTRRVTGRATYHTPDAGDPTDTGWDIEPDAALTPSQLASTCEAYYFHNAASLQTQRVEMGAQTVAYGQRAATCFYDNGVLIVQGVLLPLTARVRFRGTAKQQFAVEGLSQLTAYDAANGTFASTTDRIDVTVGSDGNTPYFYVLPADDSARLLTLHLYGTAVATRTMEATTLQPATTGYITLPTFTKPGKWLLAEPISGDDFPEDVNWDEGAAINAQISGDDFPADQQWDYGTPSSDPYAHDENWD